MDYYIKEFVDYLQYIKIINEESVSLFINVYNGIISSLNKNPENNKLINDKSLNSIFTNTSPSKYDVIIRTIYEYLTSLNENQFKILSKGIIDGYNENKNKIKSKYCFRLLEIYQNKDIKYYIKKWKKNILNRKKEEKTRNDSNNFSNQYSSKTSNNQNLKPNKKYLDKSNITKIINEKKKENVIKTKDFISRQEKFYQKLQKSREKAYTKNEEEMQLLCSFSPKLNTNNPNIKSKYQSTPNQKNERLKTANSINSNNINNINNYNHNNNNRITSPNNSKLISQRLYNEYTKIQNRKRELQKEIDNERGITFKPKSFTTNSGYNIESNFGERNKKLLEERQNFAFVYDYLRQKKYNEGKIGKKSDDLLQNYLMSNNYSNNNYNELLPDLPNNEED